MKEHKYYSIGSEKNIIFSNTAMGYLNPRQGGSPKKFLESFDKNKEFLNTRSVSNGKVVHAYIEEPENFAIDSLDKPTDSICDWVSEILRIIDSKNEVSSCTIQSEIESSQFKSFTDAVCFAHPNEIDLTNELSRDIIFQARFNLELFNNIKKPETLIKKFNESGAIPYLLFLLQNSDKHILSASDKEIVDNCINSLKNNKFVQNKLFRPENDSFQVFKEIGIFVEIPVQLRSGEIVKLKGKALIDNLQIDSESNNVIINDLKTKGKSIYDMSPNRDRGTLGSVKSFRYYRQLAWYAFAVKCISNPDIRTKVIDFDGNIIDSIKFNPNKEVKVYTNIVAVETFGDFRSGVIPINNEWIKKGEKETESLVHRLAWHVHHNIWDIGMEEYLNNGNIPIENP